MSKTKKRAMIESDTDDSGSSEVEQVCGEGKVHRYVHKARELRSALRSMHGRLTLGICGLSYKEKNKLRSQNIL